MQFIHLILALAFALSSMLPATARSADSNGPIEPLSSGFHLGYGTFAPVPVDQLPALEERIAEATDAGIDVTRVMVDWAEIETKPGQYDLSILDDQMERVPDNARLFLTLGVTDVDHYSVPEDLLDSNGQLSAPLDEPGVIDRYLALLDEVLPTLANDHGLFALSVANEPDALLTDRPAEEATALATFTSSVSDYVAERFPGLPVTLSISGPGVVFAPDFIPELIAATDIATFNWGCLDFETFGVTGISAIPDEIALLLAAAGDRDIIIQELSCASGYSEGASYIGSTPQRQAEWFDAFFTAMAADTRFRAAFVLDLVDWGPDLAAQYTEFLRAEGLDDIANRYEEFLATWGLLAFDLTPKPAWQVFLDHLART